MSVRYRSEQCPAGSLITVIVGIVGGLVLSDGYTDDVQCLTEENGICRFE